MKQQPELTDFVDQSLLRRDYAYLFERFFYYLDDNPADEMGVVVFDELEKSRSHILLDQMTEYFLKTRKGRERSASIIPEPLFVHSDLTTGIQLADYVAYIIAWGFRLPGMDLPGREELKGLVGQVSDLRYRSTRVVKEINEYRESQIWSIALING